MYVKCLKIIWREITEPIKLEDIQGSFRSSCDTAVKFLLNLGSMPDMPMLILQTLKKHMTVSLEKTF